MKSCYKNILLSMSVAGFLVACGNNGPSKEIAENIYNSNAKRTTAKVTDLRCDPAPHGSFSCFIAYKTYWTKEGAKEAQDFYQERNDIPLYAIKTPEIAQNYYLGGRNDLPLLMKSVKEGEPASDLTENDDAIFKQVDGRWESDAFKATN